MRPQFLRKVLEEHIHPRGRHRVDGHTVHARGASVCAHTGPCPPKNVHAVDMAIHGMKPAFGLLLGTAVKRPLQGSDLVQRTTARSCGHFLPADGTSRNGTQPGPSLFANRIDEAGALRSQRVLLSRRSPLLRPPPTASRQPAISRFCRLQASHASRAANPGPRRLSPVPRTTFRPFHAPYAGRFFDDRSRSEIIFRGLRQTSTGSAPP